MFVQELSDDDLNHRRDAYGKMLQKFRMMVKRRRDIFGDECTIYQSSQLRKIVFWSKQNPYYCEKVEHHYLHIIIWRAMNSEHLFGPCFFDGPVNHLNYLHVLENWFIPQLQSLGIESNVWFQQDGTSARFAKL